MRERERDHALKVGFGADQERGLAAEGRVYSGAERQDNHDSDQ